MTKKVLVLGAKGRFGRHASQAFFDAGWSVSGFARDWTETRPPIFTDVFSGDAFLEEDIRHAAAGQDVIVNALNPPYESWERSLPRLTASILAAAESSGATVMVPGNVYNYGTKMPAVLFEETPYLPDVRKGIFRQEMEETYKRATSQGVQTVILRGGDFIEDQKTGNWFDSYIAHKIDAGHIVYPGPLDRVHAWAYLPDMARAMAGLADKRGELDCFTILCFEGFNLTGSELIAAIEQVAGRALKRKKLPWMMMKGLSVFAPTIKEVVEMKYLWDVPHAINGSKLKALVPELTSTPLETALRQSLQL